MILLLYIISICRIAWPPAFPPRQLPLIAQHVAELYGGYDGTAVGIGVVVGVVMGVIGVCCVWALWSVPVFRRFDGVSSMGCI